MPESNFSFIKNTILRQNLDETFNHILILLSFVEATSQKESIKSAFRKTIIIHTASIVEALLFYIIDSEFSDEDITEYYTKWKLKNKKEIYIIDDTHKILAGEYTKERSEINKEKMNLGQITIFLQDKGILDDELFKKVNSIRMLRNEQHIGTHRSVKKYSRKDLEKAFSVASDVKRFVIKMVKS